MNCYNGEEYLNEALDSIFKQTYNNWELIFWDNFSTDKSKEILGEYKDQRIKYYRSKTHTSQYEARKNAVEECEGEFIAFLDVDDWWEADKLEKQIVTFDDPDVGFSCCNYWIINERKGVKAKIAFKTIPSGFITEKLLVSNFVGMSTLMIRTSAYHSIKYGFNPEFEIIGDYDLVLRLSLNYKLSSINDTLSYYRCHNQNLSYLKFELNISELERWITNADDFSNFKNLNYLRNFVYFYRGLLNILDKKRFKALSQLSKITSIYLKLKLLIILTMPIWLIKKVRS